MNKDKKIKELKELIQAILLNRHECFIPEDGNPKKLYSWTERAREAIKEL